MIRNVCRYMKIGFDSIFLKCAKFIAMRGYATNFDIDYLSIIKMPFRIGSELTQSLKNRLHSRLAAILSQSLSYCVMAV